MTNLTKIWKLEDPDIKPDSDNNLFCLDESYEHNFGISCTI